MNRRRFLQAAGVSLLAEPIGTAVAQSPGKVPRVGVLSSLAPPPAPPGSEPPLTIGTRTATRQAPRIASWGRSPTSSLVMWTMARAGDCYVAATVALLTS